MKSVTNYPVIFISAISLSAAVIVLYALFFSPTQEQINSVNDKAKKEITQNSDAPTIDEKIEVKTVTREDALEKDNRIFFENGFIKHLVVRKKYSYLILLQQITVILSIQAGPLGQILKHQTQIQFGKLMEQIN